MLDTRPELSREHHVGMTMHALMSAAADVRALTDSEVRDSEADLELTVSVLLGRLRQVSGTADTS